MDLSNTPLHFPHKEMSSGSDSQSPDSMAQNSNLTQDNKKLRPPDGDPQKCPRCESTNTKFCYYNNYSLTQPRYFCKSCRRYWTKGGTLRNVPVGGGCRKSSKRSSSSSPSQFLKRPHGRDTLVPTMAHHHFPNSLSTYSNTGLLGMGFDQDLAQPMSQRALFDQYDGMELMQYGNGGAGLMFQSLCGYNEANCASGISEEMCIAPYEEVKQEMMGLPWQGMNGEIGSLENNWSGFVGNPSWGLLNTHALM